MGASNSVEPLSKSEKELKRRLLSVRAGAQNSEHVWLINGARNGPKRGKVYLPLKTNTFVASWTRFDDSKLLESLPLLLEWSGDGRA